MKKISFLFLMLFLSISFLACDDDDDSTTVTYDPPTLATTADKSFSEAFADLTSLTSTADVTHNDGVGYTGYSLDQFVPKSTINALVDLDEESGDARNLFAYNVVATDAFSFRDKSDFDLNWTDFSSGYYLSDHLETPVSFPSEEILKSFDVKGATTINLYRKVDFKTTDGTTIMVEIGAFTTSTINYQNWRQTDNNADAGFAFSELIYDYITTTPESYSYKITTVDNYVGEGDDYISDNIVTWEIAQNAYFLPSSGEGEEAKIIFLNADATETTYATQAYKNIKYPQIIELISSK